MRAGVQMNYNQKAYNQRYKYNIPVSVFADIYSRLTEGFGEMPVVIGGRAVNILCFNETRFTHDVDVVLSKDPSERKENLEKENFMIKRNERGKIVGAEDLKDHSYDPITLDFYYSRPINGITIKEILKNVEEVNVAHTKVLVPKPPIMLMLKYDAGRLKDIKDFELLLRNFYGSKKESLFENEKKLFDELLENHKGDKKGMNRLLSEYYYYNQAKSQLRK